MQQLQSQTRSFSPRPTAHATRLGLAVNTALVAAAFLFVGAVTLGLFP
jgi:hypothetical protein